MFASWYIYVRQTLAYPSRREEEDAHMCPCGKVKESRTKNVGECDVYKEERGVLEMRKIDERDMEKLNSLLINVVQGGKNAILGDRWWPLHANQGGNKTLETF